MGSRAERVSKNLLNKGRQHKGGLDTQTKHKKCILDRNKPHEPSQIFMYLYRLVPYKRRMNEGKWCCHSRCECSFSATHTITSIWQLLLIRQGQCTRQYIGLDCLFFFRWHCHCSARTSGISSCTVRGAFSPVSSLEGNSAVQYKNSNHRMIKCFATIMSIDSPFSRTVAERLHCYTSPTSAPSCCSEDHWLCR